MKENKEYCPLCSKDNNCCNSEDKSFADCWCTKELFPNEIFELLPLAEIRKTCICKKCLEAFI